MLVVLGVSPYGQQVHKAFRECRCLPWYGQSPDINGLCVNKEIGLFLAHRQEGALGLKGVSVECGGGGAGGGGEGGGGLSWLLL